jgi:hypothetical protein
MFGWTGRRSLVVAAVVCAGLGAGSAWAVQASASGSGSSTPSTPTAPKLPPRPAGAAKVAPAVIATNAHCGQTLTASVTLNGDLVCSGAGLIIAKDSVVLNLNSHTISGPGASTGYYGVELSGKSDTVENGVITRFAYGIFTQGTTDTILNMRLNNSEYGVVDIGSGLKVTNSTAAFNAGYGMYEGGQALPTPAITNSTPTRVPASFSRASRPS